MPNINNSLLKVLICQNCNKYFLKRVHILISADKISKIKLQVVFHEIHRSKYLLFILLCLKMLTTSSPLLHSLPLTTVNRAGPHTGMDAISISLQQEHGLMLRLTVKARYKEIYTYLIYN